MPDLAAYLRAGAGAPTRVLPCAPWICDWIALRTGVDPIADMRPDWSERAVLRVMVEEGGLAAMTRRRLSAAGLVETRRPHPGDVGIVIGGLGETLAIRTAHGWAGKGPQGVVVGAFEMKEAWSVPCLS